MNISDALELAQIGSLFVATWFYEPSGSNVGDIFIKMSDGWFYVNDDKIMDTEPYAVSSIANDYYMDNWVIM